ncbi:MAG TPA: MBL fold metallo-hydrolase [Solirubrobacteraceae bacterium]|jgi:L-ascorbate metabolism protein UlaG (beta-lactamase superfamily)
MHVEWYGQSAFRLTGESATVFIDPFGDTSQFAARGITIDYPLISGVSADLLLVTHEHADHNGVEAIDGDPVLLRSTAGKLDSPIGTIVAVASEHDASAGTERGPNTIFSFVLDGVRVAHFGDFGQSVLREEQAAAIGEVDLLFVPVGGGFTIGAADAAAIVEKLRPRWVVPMHYRTERLNFLETADDFLARMDEVRLLDGVGFDTDELGEAAGATLTVVPAAP